MTQENLKLLLKHFKEVGNQAAAEDILKKYPHLQIVEVLPVKSKRGK